MKLMDEMMLFDLDSCLDLNSFETFDDNLNYSSQYVDFACDDLDQFSNSIKNCSLIDDLDFFGSSSNEVDFAADFCNFNDPDAFKFDSSFDNNLDITTDSSLLSQIETNSLVPINDKRDVKKKLLDLTQKKLNTLNYDTKLRNQVLLKSALKNVNSIDEENLLGTKSKLDEESKNEYEDDLNKVKSSPRKRNFKQNLMNPKNDVEINEEIKIKKQKLHHSEEENFLNQNSLNQNKDELTLNNLANSFIKLKTQQLQD